MQITTILIQQRKPSVQVYKTNIKPCQQTVKTTRQLRKILYIRPMLMKQSTHITFIG